MPLATPLAALLILFAGALALPGPVAAQASAHLQPLDLVHHELDRLAAWGLIDTILVGQRPYSRVRAAKLAAQAMRARARLDAASPLAPAADVALARLAARLGPELSALGMAPASARPLVGEARLDATWTDSPARAVRSNQLGATMALINPMLAYDLGRDVVEGTTTALEVELGGVLGGRVAGTLRPRAQLALARDSGGSDVTLGLQTGHARLLLGNLAVTVGHDHVVWGQGPRGGLVLSTNPGALLMASLATEDPVVLPGPFRALGPSTYQLFLADLGTEGQRYDHSQLFGWRLSFLPSRRLEVGAEFLVESGGEGAPASSLGDRILDYLFFPDVLITDSELSASNKIAGLDARVRVPEARGLELWVEMAIDDIDIDRLRSMLWEDGSWSVGARLARLNASGTLAMHVEGQHTGLRMYAHGDFTGGLTLERHLLGSGLGPNANGASVALEWEVDPRNGLTLGGSVERRSGDPYLLVAGTPYYFARLGIQPKEMRWQARAGWERFAGDRWGVRVEGGYERVTHFDFASGRALNNLMVRTVITGRLP